MITQTPGFQDLTHDSQTTFRALLTALAEPGTLRSISAQLEPPLGLNPACAAACLTLFDLETEIWLQPGWDSAIHQALKQWLLFHTGCRFTLQPQAADFAVIWDVAALDSLKQFNWGTPEAPEDSTTLVVQVDGLEDGSSVTLTGPGILGKREVAPQLPYQFWDQWLTNTQAYPLGIDVFLCAGISILGLPRTTQSLSR